MSDAKKIAAFVLGGPKADEGEDDEASMPPLSEIMSEFISAVKSGDSKAAAKAYHAAWMHCEDAQDGGSDDMKEDDSAY